MINLIVAFTVLCLFTLISRVAYASGFEINDTVTTQNETENDYKSFANGVKQRWEASS